MSVTPVATLVHSDRATGLSASPLAASSDLQASRSGSSRAPSTSSTIACPATRGDARANDSLSKSPETDGEEGGDSDPERNEGRKDDVSP